MNQTFIDRISEQKYSFFGVFFVVFLFSYLLLVTIDFVPEAKKATESELKNPEKSVKVEQAADSKKLPLGTFEVPNEPTSLYIEKLGKTLKIANPTSKVVADLDNALLSATVRHPDSALLGQNGNILILGHSSYLPVVYNKNFQAFNGIQNLAWGDKIELRSKDKVVIYQVDKVFKAKAEDVTVPLNVTGPRLTLATCNSFGGKDDRFVVEAVPVEVRTL